jgi:hypothetical protein
MRVSDDVHDHLSIKACAIAIDFVSEFVVYEEKDHEIAGHPNTI